MVNNKVKSDPIKTVLVITVGFLVIYMTTEWKPAILIALVIGVGGILSNYISSKIDYLWMKLAWLLGLIMPNILLTIVFYLMLTPIAFLSRVFSKNEPLSLKNNKNSLFKDTNKQYDKDSFINPW